MPIHWENETFSFGEVATPDDALLDRYIGQNTSRLDGNDTVFFGLDSVLDFRLAEGKFGDPNNQQLRNVLKGFAGPETLFNRLEAQRNRALNRREIGRYLVTFVDNHDSFWQPSGRFGAGAAARTDYWCHRLLDLYTWNAVSLLRNGGGFRGQRWRQ